MDTDCTLNMPLGFFYAFLLASITNLQTVLDCNTWSSVGCRIQLQTFQFPAERFWRHPAEPSSVAGFELSANRVR